MPSTATEVGRRTLLNRLYRRYEADSAFAHMLAGTRGVVPGDGATHPLVVFVGEAPGEKEDKQAKPFIGASGRMLNELLASVNLERERVFITNTVKIRPTKPHPETSKRLLNRPPTDEEKRASIPYLREEMGLLGNPPIVVLGKHARSAMDLLLHKGTGYPLNEDKSIRLGEWSTLYGTKILALHHPAYAIYQQANRPLLFEMFKAVREVWS